MNKKWNVLLNTGYSIIEAEEFLIGDFEELVLFDTCDCCDDMIIKAVYPKGHWAGLELIEEKRDELIG